jgi:hypothetical protein
MANAERGYVDLTVGDKSYQLRFSTNALAEVETLLDRDIGEIVNQLQAGRISALRALLYAALREKHPKVSLLDAGDILDGDRAMVGEALGKALNLAFPESTGAAENPPDASSEAGMSS